MSSFCASSTSLSASALDLATSLAAHVRPKSKRSWDAVTLVDPKSPELESPVTELIDRARPRLPAPESWGSRGARAWFTRCWAAT